jgi:WD40 repeat protein
MDSEFSVSVAIALGCSGIIVDPFDPSVVIVQCPNVVHVFSFGSTLKIQLEIKTVDVDQMHVQWTAVEFLSARTLLLTSGGKGYLYYLGMESDLKIASVATLVKQEPSAIVLVSDGVTAIYVSQLDLSARETNAVLIAICGDESARLVHVTSTSEREHLLVNVGESWGLEARVGRMWASIYASNLPLSPPSETCTQALPLVLTPRDANVDFGLIGSVKPQFTAMALISKSKVALGQIDGSIWIIPVSNLVSNTLVPDQKFESNTSAIVYLYVTELNGQKEHLVGGSSDGYVTIWNISTGALLYSHCAHPQRVAFLNQALVDGKQCLLSVSPDGSLFIVDLVEFGWFCS